MDLRYWGCVNIRLVYLPAHFDAKSLVRHGFERTPATVVAALRRGFCNPSSPMRSWSIIISFPEASKASGKSLPGIAKIGGPGVHRFLPKASVGDLLAVLRYFDMGLAFKHGCGVVINKMFKLGLLGFVHLSKLHAASVLLC